MNVNDNKKELCDKIANEFGFSNYESIKKHLNENLSLIDNNIVKFKLMNFLENYDRYSITEISKNGRLLIKRAFDYINEQEKELLIYLDGKLIVKRNFGKIPFYKIKYDEIDKQSVYENSREINENNLIIHLCSYPKPKMDLITALKKANIFDNELFLELLKDQNITLSSKEKITALYNAGVDNWSGYEIAIESAEEETGMNWYDLSYEDQLIFLESSGVDNWNYYDDAILDYKNDLFDYKSLSEEKIVECFQINEELIMKKWSNYNILKKIYHGLD